MLNIKLVGYEVDTLLLNVRYYDENIQPIKKELAEELVYVLDDLQGGARQHDMALISP